MWLERGRKQASCRPGGSSLAATAGDVDELPDLHLGAEGQAVAGEGHAHGGGEGAKVGVEVVALVADQNELTGLVRRDQQRAAKVSQQGREVGGVDSAKRDGCLGLPVVGGSQCRAGGSCGCRHEKSPAASRESMSWLRARMGRLLGGYLVVSRTKKRRQDRLTGRQPEDRGKSLARGASPRPARTSDDPGGGKDGCKLEGPARIRAFKHYDQCDEAAPNPSKFSKTLSGRGGIVLIVEFDVEPGAGVSPAALGGCE